MHLQALQQIWTTDIEVVNFCSEVSSLPQDEAQFLGYLNACLRTQTLVLKSLCLVAARGKSLVTKDNSCRILRYM